jgi:hypothetical protein
MAPFVFQFGTFHQTALAQNSCTNRPFEMRRCGEIGIRNGLKIAGFAISPLIKIDQLRFDLRGQIVKIREFLMRTEA